MNTNTATIDGDLSVRKIIAFDVFRWTLRLGFAIAPRELGGERRYRRKQMRLSDIPPHLRADLGLPLEEDRRVIEIAIHPFVIR